MNIINGTLCGATQNLTDAFMHYVCLRMQFRSNVMKEFSAAEKDDKRFEEFCPIKH